MVLHPGVGRCRPTGRGRRHQSRDPVPSAPAHVRCCRCSCPWHASPPLPVRARPAR